MRRPPSIEERHFTDTPVLWREGAKNRLPRQQSQAARLDVQHGRLLGKSPQVFARNIAEVLGRCTPASPCRRAACERCTLALRRASVEEGRWFQIRGGDSWFITIVREKDILVPGRLSTALFYELRAFLREAFHKTGVSRA